MKQSGTFHRKRNVFVVSGGQNMQERHFLNDVKHTYHSILVIDMLFLYLF